MAREFFVNADFDLSLRSGWNPTTGDARLRQAAELPMHLLLLGMCEDSVLVPVVPPEEFCDYLGRLGIPPPRVSVVPDFNPGARFTPVGWNGEASRLNRKYDRPSSHPPLDVVHRVNGRRFAAAVEREVFGDEFILGEFRTLDALCALLDARPPGEEGWVVKSEHGNSGLGNLRLRSPDLSDSDRRIVNRLVAQDECMILERWRPRELDIAAVFEVDAAGNALDINLHEVVNTTDGAFIGAIFESHSLLLEPWRSAIHDAVGLVARRLAEAGYFGPVCVDAFVWTDGDRHRLRPIVEINARLHVSSFVNRVRERWIRDRVVYWRLFLSRKLEIPSDFRELEAALGADAFDSEQRRGVLLTSPIIFDSPPCRPARFGVLLAAEDRNEVRAMEHRLREKFER